MSETVLRPYQLEASDFIYDRVGSALFLDPGLGKTLAVLKTLDRLKKEHKGQIQVFVFAPIRVVESVWRQESKKWGFDLTFSLVRGQPNERKHALAMKADVYLINFELLPWLFSLPVRDWKRRNGNSVRTRDIQTILVVDESTMLKSPKTKRWKSLKPNLKHFQKRVILTGTPIPATYLDLWSQIGILDMGKRLETAFGRYQKKYFESDYMGFSWTPKEGAQEVIISLISDICYRTTLKEALVDEPIEVPRLIELTTKELEKYKEMEKHAIAEFMEENEIETITALSAAALHGKLSQLAQGFIYTKEKETINFHHRKMEIIDETVEGLNGKPLLVVYKFREEIRRLKEMFGNDFTVLNELPTEEVVGKWNDGKIRILGMHPRSGGHGLNLQYGGHNMLMTCPLYNAEHYDQVIRRLARSGQTETVVCQVLKMQGTVDETINNKLGLRIDNQVAFLSYINNIAHN